MSNSYIEDASVFFVECSSKISMDMGFQETIQGVLNFALGVERILKGILYSINPTYVLVSPEFNHSVSILYKNKIIQEEGKTSSVLAKEPIADVITFRNSLLRAATVSMAARSNKNKLFGLSNYRDVIAHHELKQINIYEAKVLLQRDYYFILLDFIDELKSPRAAWFGAYEKNLIEISRNFNQEVKNVIRLKLEEHRKTWESNRNSTDYIKKCRAKTSVLLDRDDSHETNCPSCNKTAIVITEPDFVVDVGSLEKTQIGEFVKLVHCEYCGLHIDAGNELDELGYGKGSYWKFDDEIPF